MPSCTSTPANGHLHQRNSFLTVGLIGGRFLSMLQAGPAGERLWLARFDHINVAPIDIAGVDDLPPIG